MTVPNDQLALAAGVTALTNQLATGLESGAADLYEYVTPVTAELLRWWFGEAACAMRRWNFHAGQRQAILNTIVAHEVVGASTLLDLYMKAAVGALTDVRLSEVVREKHRHPKYCLKMATGTGKTWVLQALLIWQLLNKSAALAEGHDHSRFTRRFLIVAPGLIVYERLLDAFCGKLQDGVRDFTTSDVARYADLFIPDAYREQVSGFVHSNVCDKTEIGLKATGNGLIGITNWHALSDVDDDVAEDSEAALTPEQVASDLLPLASGKAAGNSLDALDKRHARPSVVDFLVGLPDLMVFNDEAHHIHEIKREGEATEVEWQKSLSRIAASKGQRFMQVDFSATPYNDIGSGSSRGRRYFPHIIADFDLKSAMRAGLVKSLVLDRRQEVGALPLEFRVEHDADGNPVLSQGQRVMLRAGLQKLRMLERDFAAINPERHPKMLVVCEDTTVPSLVEQFLHEEGLGDDDVLTVDSGKRSELKAEEWAALRERLFDADRHASPRVIVSVLMLREGFDINNICVIVPLRSSQAQILLEQTIGRGLRLMWRDEEYADIKRENRKRINQGLEPKSLLDILSIVEHPAYQSFYDELEAAGLVGSTTDVSDGNSAGDMITVGLRDNFEEFDFAIPFIVQEADEELTHSAPDIAKLPSFSSMTHEALSTLMGKGDRFVSQDLQSNTLFGDYRVDGALMQVDGYNDFLSRLTRRIAQALSRPLTPKTPTPYMQVNTVELTGWLDRYIHERLFDGDFDPLQGENWRLLLLQPVLSHITKIFAEALIGGEQQMPIGKAEVWQRKLSDVPRLTMRESSSLVVGKCIYERLPYPSRHGGLERKFIEWAQSDSHIRAFCKISETRHDFLRFRYIKEDGMPAFYHPDFLVRTGLAIYLVETKAQNQLTHPDVQRKLKAAAARCSRINRLEGKYRQHLPWHYVLLGEEVFHAWRREGVHLAELLAFARLHHLDAQATQGNLSLA